MPSSLLGAEATGIAIGLDPHRQRCLRTAVRWAQENRSREFQIPGIAYMEMLIGSRSKSEIAASQKFLDNFYLVWQSEPENELAADIWPKPARRYHRRSSI